MKKTIRRILWGIKGHPGTKSLVILVLYGGIVGYLARGSWIAIMVYALIMLTVVLPIYLYGAYELGQYKEIQLVRDLDKI